MSDQEYSDEEIKHMEELASQGIPGMPEGMENPLELWLDGEWRPPYWFRVLLKRGPYDSWSFEFLTHESAVAFVGGIMSGGCRLGVKRDSRKTSQRDSAALTIERVILEEVEKDEAEWQRIHDEHEAQKAADKEPYENYVVKEEK